jgi:hypothetical protein
MKNKFYKTKTKKKGKDAFISYMSKASAQGKRQGEKEKLKVKNPPWGNGNSCTEEGDERRWCGLIQSASTYPGPGHSS